MRHRLALCLALLVVVPTRTEAQERVPGAPPGWRVDRWTVADGLPGNFIADVARTGDGYLWLSASGILTRFDGVRFTGHPRHAHPGLPASSLRSLAAGRGDTLWIVTDAGDVIAASRGRFTVTARLDRSTWTVAADDAGGLALGMPGNGVGHRRNGFDPVAATVYRGSQDGRRLLPQLWLDGGDRVWVNDLDSVRTVGDDDAPGVAPSLFTVLPVDARTGSVLLADSADGLVTLRRPDGTRVARMPRGAGIPRLVDAQGALWVERADATLDVVPDEGAGTPVTIPLGDGVGAGRFLHDDDGSVWITTATSGLLRVRRTAFATLSTAEGLLEARALRLAAAPDGSVLVSDGTRAIHRLRGTRVEGPFLPDGRPLWPALAVDRRGVAWVGTGDIGDVRLLGLSPTGDTVAATPFPEDVIDIVPDAREPGVLWVLGNGVHRVLTDGPDAPRIASTPLASVHSLARLVAREDGGVWVRAPTSLVRVSTDGAHPFPIPDSLLGADLRAVLEEPDGTVWLGTYGGGILHLGGEDPTRITSDHGLVEDVVTSLLVDDRGMVWMGGNRSVHRVALAELRAFVAGEVERVRGVGYDGDDGLDNAETSGPSGVRDAAGRLWFPTFGGAAVVDPARLAEAEARPPPVLLQAVTWGDTTVRVESGHAVTLPRDVRDFTLHFTSPSLADPEGVRFEHRLGGVDAGWRGPEVERTVHYADVRGGTHLFEVRARSGAGVPSARTATLELTVPRRFTETVWFPLLLLLGTAVATGSFVRSRMRAAEAREAALEGVVRERTDALLREKARAEEALETVTAQRRALEQLDEAKSRFFANVTHELRTPLTLLLGPLRDLQAGDAEELPDRVRGELRLAGENAERLLDLVEQLLDIARLEAGELPLRPVRTELPALLDRVTEQFRAWATRRGVDFDVDASAVAGEAVLDPDCLRKILENLLGNAFKFTPEGGRVTLEVETRPSSDGLELRARVADTGRGIPEDELEAIFERFRRVDEREGTVGGSGVGLSLVRELVRLMDGEVAVESRPGEGTTFTVTLPVGAVPGPAGTVTDTDPEGSDALPPLVVVAEDHPDLRAYVRRHLEPDFRVVEAEDGEAALAAAFEHVPDAVVTDVMMPGMDGEALCRRLRSEPELAWVPVIMLTARSARESRLSGLREGADAYIAKPFDPEELVLTLRNLVASQRRLRERLASEGRALPEVVPPWPGGDDGDDDGFRTRLLEALAEHLGDEELSPESLAGALHMSRSTLYRKVQDALDASPMDVVWSYRLDHAARWLEETDGTVAEVAYAVGFKSVSHFSRKFRERFGHTPSEHRDG